METNPLCSCEANIKQPTQHFENDNVFSFPSQIQLVGGIIQICSDFLFKKFRNTHHFSQVLLVVLQFGEILLRYLVISDIGKKSF